MKTIIIGLIVALVIGILVYSSMNLSNEQFAIMLGVLLFIPTVWLGRVHKLEKARSKQLLQNGLNHYREHVHHRRLIKKTS